MNGPGGPESQYRRRAGLKNQATKSGQFDRREDPMSKTESPATAYLRRLGERRGSPAPDIHDNVHTGSGKRHRRQ